MVLVAQARASEAGVFTPFIGRRLECEVTEVDRKGKTLVVSRRKVVERQRAAELAIINAVQQALANPTASASEASQPEPKPSKPVAKPRKPKKAASQVATQPLWSAGAGDLLNPPYDLDVPAGGDAAC